MSPKKYWDQRWKVKLDPVAPQIEVETSLRNINSIMTRYECSNILEIGCGRAEIRDLPGYLGLDFSPTVLKNNDLPHFLYADITKRIPLPDKTFDAVLSRYVLLHVPFDRIEMAVKEMSRVAKKCIILYETWSSNPEQNGTWCFKHNLPKLFSEHFDGALVLVKKDGAKEEIIYPSSSLEEYQMVHITTML